MRTHTILRAMAYRKMSMSLATLLFTSLQLLLQVNNAALLSSEDEVLYTAHFPNGKTYTYDTGKGHAWAYWNGTTADEDILDAHNVARRELNLTELEKSSTLVQFATEHVQLCGNNTEPDIFSVLPRLEGTSLVVNIWEVADADMALTFTQVGENFYSSKAKEDYRNGYTPANYSDNIYSTSYRHLYAYYQIIHPDLRHIGCYGRRCDPITNPKRTSIHKYLSSRYVHWTYIVCYYDNKTDSGVTASKSSGDSSQSVAPQMTLATSLAEESVATTTELPVPSQTSSFSQFESATSSRMQHKESAGTSTSHWSIHSSPMLSSTLHRQTELFTKAAVDDKHDVRITDRRETCSNSHLFPKLLLFTLTTAAGVLLFVCVVLITILCILIPYYKREIQRLTAKRIKDIVMSNIHTAPNIGGCGRTCDHEVNFTATLIHDKSVYLHILPEDGSLDAYDDQDMVVTTKSFPITRKGIIDSLENICEVGGGSQSISVMQPSLNGVEASGYENDFVSEIRFLDESKASVSE